jgi:hypothetical protein
MVLTAYSVLSPAIGLFCHRHWRKVISANLIPASRNQDHTASPSAINALVSCVIASIASRAQRVVTIAKRPSLLGHGMTLLYCCFYLFEKRKIFRGRTGQKGKSVAAMVSWPASWFETVLRTSSPWASRIML